MGERHGIVVGIDGSPGSIAAVRWAQDRVAEFGPIRPVYVWAIPTLAIAGSPLGFAPPPPVDEMEAAAERAAHTLADELGFTPEEIDVRQGDTGTVLCDIAADANLLVVGTRSRGPAAGNLLGSVGRYCADHSPTPLVIVPAERSTVAAAQNVIVGVDGSPNASAALRWAGANFPDATITAVASWQTPVDGPVMFGGGRFDVTAFRAQATSIADETVAKVVADLGLETDSIGRRVVEGDPRFTLHQEQARAGLLVVGRRGRGGIAHLLLGSTTTSLIHQPSCPIAVIPPEQDHD